MTHLPNLPAKSVVLHQFFWEGGEGAPPLSSCLHYCIILHECCVSGFWWGNLRERDNLADPDVDGRTILRWIFRKQNEGVWTGSSWFRIGTVGGHF